MKLVIVESYNKIKSIKKFLGNDYEVIASGGHIRELKSSGYGFNKDTLMPIWEVYENSHTKNSEEKTIASIKRYAKNAEAILLATDPDREGESISWHLFDILDKKEQSKCKRITFNEITAKAINKAIESPRDIDMDLVYSQWARRILDRLVGYGLSSLVKSKLNARSAGRVQSVALLFIVERYLEIKNFIPKNWWTIEAKLQGPKKMIVPTFLRKSSIEAKLYEKDEREIKFAQEDEAKKCLSLLGDEYKLYQIDEPKIVPNASKIPFQTDTLLTTAYNKLGWSTSRTNKVAQELYNGIDIQGTVTSLISYPRTDTNRLNPDFIATVRELINKDYGKEYVCNNVKEAVQGELVQGAHEGIRPIDIEITPKSLEGKINGKSANDQLKLYTLIWTQTMSSFMMPPSSKSFVYRFSNNESEKFYTSYRRLVFKGYYALPHYEKERIDADIDLSSLKIGDILKEHTKAEIVKHSTEPPALYNEGSLVKELKNSGVGRPSTYSAMVNIVKDRGYVENSKKLSPSEIGILLIENLIKECGDFISKKFTMNMETELDQIAEGKMDWNKWIRKFKTEFDNNLVEARKNMVKVQPKLVGRECPKCGADLIYQNNRISKSQFIGCSKYRDGCKYTESITNGGETQKKQAILIDEMCPECGKQLIERYNKRGEPFIACTGFPKCRFIKSSPNNKKPSKEKTTN